VTKRYLPPAPDTSKQAVAELAALALVFGTIALIGFHREIPPELAAAFGSSTTWLFVQGMQQIQQHPADTTHERENTQEGEQIDHS